VNTHNITSTFSAQDTAKRGLVLGIDPGISGAWAMLTAAGELLRVADIPVANNMVAGAVLAGELTGYNFSYAVIERVGAMPGQGVSSMFRFGMATGIVTGVLAALGISILHVAPTVWKKHFNLSADKEASRMRAIEQWPKHAASFARKMDHGRAEAALIALWGARAAALTGAA
jgi:crossover junction endodeoxyribonuclease RuvC